MNVAIVQIGNSRGVRLPKAVLDQVGDMGKTRPGVIVSPDEANDALRTVLVAPLTSRRRAWPTRVPVNVAGEAGDAALDQMRAVDKRRLASKVGAVSGPEGAALLAALQEMFAP